MICEETKHGLVSIAEALAKKEGIRYVNIEMPPERRDQLGIPRLYTIDPESEIPPEQKTNWNIGTINGKPTWSTNSSVPCPALER